jgi:outer membrane protein OmpA-like peptidoglycan-associated protein
MQQGEVVMSHGRFRFAAVVALGAAFGLAVSAAGQEPFAKLVGQYKVQAVKSSAALELPFIIWGGDVATLYANGGRTTQPGRLFHQQGLNFNMVPGDDFPKQVKRYLEGDSPFLRGTLSMLGLASEVVGAQESTRPVVFLQMTWSRGDHMVAREQIKTLNDLKGKKIALQRGGPHVGMLDDILEAAGLKWTDVQVHWVDDITGAKGAAEAFRSDKSIDCCMVISPDMLGLTGGLRSTGTGSEGSVKGAKVLVSTADSLTRSVADVYACRKDFYDANREIIEKFTAAYLKACEELLAHKRQYESKGKAGGAKYWSILQMTQQVYGTEVIPTLEADAHGLISDCAFVGLQGNKSYFMDEGNLVGFKAKQPSVLKLALALGAASKESPLLSHDLDYNRIRQLGNLTEAASTAGPEVFELGETLVSFSIPFEPNQTEFDAQVYGEDFLRAIRQAQTFGGAVLVIRGHTDPTKTLGDVVRAGEAKGILRAVGPSGNRKYFLSGKPLDIERTAEIVKLIEQGAFDGVNPNPRETMQAGLNLSKQRADAVRAAVLAFAKLKGLNIDESLIQASGAGVTEPVVARPKSMEEAKLNMRVEFRIVRKDSEAAAATDFDF